MKSIKKISIFVFSLSLLGLALISNPTLVLADVVEGCPTGAICLNNPLGNDVDSPQLLIGRVINSVLGIVGSLALLMFVFGGITWMTSSGNAEKIKRGRDILIWAAIGMVVVFSAYGLTRVVIVGLSGK